MLITKENTMNIKVNIKQLGKKRAAVEAENFPLETCPETIKDLIAASVHTCVNDYNERVRKGETASPLTEEEITGMSQIGKIAFGINYGGKEANEEEAVKAALLAYEDGLFRIFLGENEAGGLDDSINLTENDDVTFIKLTMLSGRLW